MPTPTMTTSEDPNGRQYIATVSKDGSQNVAYNPLGVVRRTKHDSLLAWKGIQEPDHMDDEPLRYSRGTVKQEDIDVLEMRETVPDPVTETAPEGKVWVEQRSVDDGESNLPDSCQMLRGYACETNGQHRTIGRSER